MWVLFDLHYIDIFQWLLRVRVSYHRIASLLYTEKLGGILLQIAQIISSILMKAIWGDKKCRAHWLKVCSITSKYLLPTVLLGAV